MNNNYSVSFDATTDTIFVKENNIQFVIDLNSGTFKRITKNKNASIVPDESINGMLNCKKALEDLNSRKNRLFEEAELLKMKICIIYDKIKEAKEDLKIK